jgi:hypothetical protein
MFIFVANHFVSLLSSRASLKFQCAAFQSLNSENIQYFLPSQSNPTRRFSIQITAQDATTLLTKAFEILTAKNRQGHCPADEYLALP